MSTFYVRKNGSGTHTTIQSAIYVAVNGDTVDIGEGTFNENVEISSKSITLQGAGKDKTIIQGKATNDIMSCSWFAGDSVLTAISAVAAQTGKSVSGTGITTCKISEVISDTQFRLETATPTSGNYTKTVVAYQTIAFSVAPTSGTFKLGYNGVDTASIAWNATAATIQTAIRAISGLATIVVTGTIASKLLTITFNGVASPFALSVSINALLPSSVLTPVLFEALVSGSSSVVLPNTTSVAVGHKVEGTGVNATITAWNATTKTATLSSPITQTGSDVVLAFRIHRNAISVTQITNPGNSSFPGSIMVSGNTEGLVIRNLRAIGFENSDLGQEAAALFMLTLAAPGHNNFLIDNCQLTAGGDCAFLHGSKPFLTNGTFQNCVIDGNTFTGSEPTDVPSFSTYISPAIISSIGASSSVVTFADMRGVILGRTFSSAGAFTSSATVTAISGNSVTINKVITGTVGASIDCTFGLTQYGVPNVPRNLFYLGTSSPLYNISNITFKNNLVSGGTGAVISATGSKSVFNCGVTINSIGGLIENNVFDGNFGAGSPNEMGVNYVLRSQQPNMVVQNNVNITSGGRGNSGYLIELGTSINNTTVDSLLIEVSQSASNPFVESIMEKGILKQISKVSSDAVFSDEANWIMVSFVFKHSSSSRRLVASFRSDFSKTKKTKLKPNMEIGDVFELQKIIISKSDRSHLVVKRSELSGASSLDFSLLAGSTV
jgi:hypothetical protein